MFRLVRSASSWGPQQPQHYMNRRLFSNAQRYDALVLGAHTENGAIRLTASKDISSKILSAMEEQLRASEFKKVDQVRTLYNLGGMKQVAIVSLGEKSKMKDPQEAARRATALGLHTLKPQGAKRIGVDISLNAHGAGEGAVLSQFSFDKLKSAAVKEKEGQVKDIEVGPFGDCDEGDMEAWSNGQIYGASQNVARMLMTSPANLMTPKLFAEEVAYLLAGLENVEVLVHDGEWAARHNMNSFISVAKGSAEPLRFLEIRYKGGKEGDKPHAFVGKGNVCDDAVQKKE